jgi:uncharacterized protein YgfB (UPF0149 family)
MAFEPLLPPDDADLAARVEALGTWAQGFLYGFGAAGPFPRGTLPAEITEVLSDFAEVARAGSVGMETVEVEEEAYAELVEFMRVGVQLVFDELSAQRAARTASSAQALTSSDFFSITRALMTLAQRRIRPAAAGNS